MKGKVALSLFALTGLSLLLALGSASTAGQDNTGQDHSAKVRKITGCLSKGDSSNEYQLTGDTGSTWEVKSDAVDFAPYVGHTVRVIGTVNNAPAHALKEKAKEKTQDNPAEHGHMTVTGVKNVSDSCSK